jgi:hypothetical protein
MSRDLLQLLSRCACQAAALKEAGLKQPGQPSTAPALSVGPVAANFGGDVMNHIRRRLGGPECDKMSLISGDHGMLPQLPRGGF